MVIHRRLSSWRILLSLFLLISFYYAIFRHTRTIQRVRYKANHLPLFECPNLNKQFLSDRQHTAYNDLKPFNCQQRILLVKDPNSELHIRIVDHLNHLKLPIRIETPTNNSLLLQLEDVGRFSLIIFANYSNYENLSSSVKSQIEEYAERFSVGIIHFSSGSKCIHILCKPKQQTIQVKFNKRSNIPFIARTDTSIDTSSFDIQDWTFLSDSNWESVLEAEDENGDINNVIIHKNLKAEQVVIGHDLTVWPITLAFQDILRYFMGNSDLTRLIQIDIDDIFVAQSGTRLVKEDIGALIQTQSDLRQFIDNFSFTLGFSGSYFKNGDPMEIEGDEQLILDASNFLWFPHTWRHNHVHEYVNKNASNLTILMQLNKEFAKEKRLNVSLNYAVSPQHSGVYPIHNALYNAWKEVWDVHVTSTEEFPHFAPASKRRGFIYKNVSVLPRQTCGLFTHTLYFHSMPEGLKNHHDSIFGGSLFKSLLLNQFSIYMTHQQNFGNDRLGSYTFLNAFRFLKCYTNLHFRWVTPKQLAYKYFERFPNERQLFYTDICADTRHVKSLPFDQTCTNVNKLPNTIIVGPQKTGTTAVREFLLLHLNASSNHDLGPGYFEETQFFAGSNYDKGVEWYRQLFNASSEKAITIFEKSANYFDNPKAPEAIHYLIPNAKIVILLIDPIERAFSWYQHMKAHNNSAALKYSAMEIFSEKIDSLEVQKLRNRCLQPGFYAKHLERWLDYFEPQQLIVLDGLEIRNEPAIVMNSLTNTLGLPRSINYGEILKFDAQKGFFCINNEESSKCLGKSKGRKYESMSNELRSHLNKIFDEPNRSLKKLLTHYKLKVPSFLTSYN